MRLPSEVMRPERMGAGASFRTKKAHACFKVPYKEMKNVSKWHSNRSILVYDIVYIYTYNE